MYKEFNILEVAEKLGLRFIKDGPGDEKIYRCPFCGDSWKHPDKGHLYINARLGTFKCHRCGAEGNSISMWAQYHGIDTKKAYKELCRDIEPGPPPEPVKITTKTEIAPVSKRDKVYRAFLSVLKLASRHKEELLSRGLTEKQIHDKMYKSIPGSDNPKIRWKIAQYLHKNYGLEGIPGFFKREGKRGTYWDFVAPRGYLIPVRDYRGRIQAMQIRLDDQSNGKYIWFSSHGKPGGTSSNAPAHYTGGKGRVWITEGPLKADIASTLLSTPFIGIPGVNSWQEADKILTLLSEKEPVIAFDADSKENPNVANALKKFINHLREMGFNPQNCQWPKSFGKGVDDVLLKLHKKEKTSVTLLIDGIPVTIRRTVTTEISVG